MATLFIPVGHDVGAFYANPGDEGPASYDVRCGDGAFRLTRDQYVVWQAAHGERGSGAEQEPSTQESIEAAARQRGAVKPGPALEELLSLGTLLQLNTESAAETQRFADTHRVIPLQRGQGNSLLTPQLFAVQAEQGPPISVSVNTYHLWMYSHLKPSLWEACRHIAEEGKGPEVAVTNTQTLRTSPRDLLAELLSALPPLLADGCLYIDRRI